MLRVISSAGRKWQLYFVYLHSSERGKQLGELRWGREGGDLDTGVALTVFLRNSVCVCVRARARVYVWVRARLCGMPLFILLCPVVLVMYLEGGMQVQVRLPAGLWVATQFRQLNNRDNSQMSWSLTTTRRSESHATIPDTRFVKK
jgi:hypothetical protein